MASPLFRVIREEKKVEEVPDGGRPDDLTPTTFGEQGFLEEDIENWLEKAPRLLGEDLLVIERQANPVEAGNLIPDLVAVDREGALVIVELKQDWSGYDIYWQAAVYAAAYWNRTADEIVDLYGEYRDDEREKAVERLIEHTGSRDAKDLKKKLNQRQRLVLVAHCFYQSAATAVLWLRERQVYVTCLRLIPHLKNESKKVCYVTMEGLIPGPNEEELLVPLRKIPSESDSAMLDRYTCQIDKFCRSVAANLRELLGQEVLPDKVNEGSVKVGDFRHFGLWYSHKPWTYDGFSFALQVRVSKAGGGPFSVAALFQFHEDTARQAGVTEGGIEELRQWMKKFTTATFGCRSRELPAGWHEVNKSIDVALDREGAERVAELLAKLIHDVYPPIEKVLGRDVPLKAVGTLTPRPAFKLVPDGTKPEDLTRTTFLEQGFSDELDRHDWLVNDPRMLGEDLLVIQRNHSDVEGLWCDILAVDRDGALVAVEARLDGDDSTAWTKRIYWRAPLHTAMCWKRTAGEVIDLYTEYLNGDREAAVEKLKQHTGSEDENDLKAKLNHRQRALLVARTFAKEVTTATLWLRERGVDVACLQLTPYLDEETGECYVDRTELMQERDPEDLLTGLRMTGRELEEHVAEMHRLQGQSPYQLTEFSRSVVTKVKNLLKLEPELVPSETSYWGHNLGYCYHYGLWHTQDPWNPGFAFSIQVRTVEGHEGLFRLTAMFQFSEETARKAGVTEGSIEKLCGLTATFAEKPGWNTRSGLSGYYEAGKTVHVALDEPGAEFAAETLAEVIREMYPRIQRALGSTAPAGAS